ncbi:hypothetical protein CC1G_02410 [Coprinopsis cinerea okayama7|uniref:Uncharacterized protein n=1 Tax=Coprinopsis cinerea (strain Okayama-7 / 130 / ATCC MYA-4618 / FGSC 9003) TaxID=240176 RepID=A8NBF0_COPC7|nr:hypothetical protein CC1G_02410 [Coprinopsis cinerea okayama7\|eukprot:XP_001832148.2 hypothetical protein CC1G_02410 [Coprinopsis cinerea okayama7\
MEHRLRNWIELNRPDLQDTAVHALKLVENQDNLFTYMFLVTLQPAFKPREKNIDPRKAFVIHVLEPVRMDEFLPKDPGNQVAINSLKQKGKDLRKQGYVGLVMMQIMVTDPIPLAHMSPFGVADIETHKPYDPNWKENFTKKASAFPGFVLPLSPQCPLK